jgi:hypothetical protein
MRQSPLQRACSGETFFDAILGIMLQLDLNCAPGAADRMLDCMQSHCNQ